MILIAALLSKFAGAEYDPAVIKQGIDDRKNVFAVDSWQKSDKGKGDSLVAKTPTKGLIMSVGPKSSGAFYSSLKSAEQLDAAEAQCFELGVIGLSPRDATERNKIKAVIQEAETATNQLTRSLTMNGVIFEVKPQNVVGLLFLSCILKPDIDPRHVK